MRKRGAKTFKAHRVGGAHVVLDAQDEIQLVENQRPVSLGTKATTEEPEHEYKLEGEYELEAAAVNYGLPVWEFYRD